MHEDKDTSFGLPSDNYLSKSCVWKGLKSIIVEFNEFVFANCRTANEVPGKNKQRKYMCIPYCGLPETSHLASAERPSNLRVIDLGISEVDGWFVLVGLAAGKSRTA